MPSSPRTSGRASVNPRGAARPAYGGYRGGAPQGPVSGRASVGGPGGRVPGGGGPGGPGGPGGRGPGGGNYGGDYGRGGRKVRPRWGRILGVTAGLLAVLLVVAGLGAWAYMSSLNDDMRRTDTFAKLTGDRPPKKVDGALNILLLGSDSRDPEAKQDSGQWRTDTIILMHVPASQDKAYLISLPRDLWVHVPESPTSEYSGTNAKLNSAYAWGGPPLMVQTVETYTGVRVDHLAIVDFWGFKKMTDTVGGVELCPEMPPGQDSFDSIHKPYRTFKKGCQNMNGTVALDYIRQRKQFPTGDFARMKHQQEFVKALMDKATSRKVFTSPTKLDNFMRAATKAVTVDEDFSLLDMAIQFRGLRSKDLTFMTTPHNGTGTMGGQSVVLSDKEKASAMFEAVANDEMAVWVKENPEKK